MDGELYKKGIHDGLLFRCIGKEETILAMTENHEGICCTHQAGIKMRWLIQDMAIIGQVF